MPTIGARVEPIKPGKALMRGQIDANLIPGILLESRRVINSSIIGWHGRRKSGVGETFWQFRPYVMGEPTSRIDWRRSARDNGIYVRDNEWEASHTIWIWADSSPSMLFKSHRIPSSKQERALTLAFAFAEIFCKAGERIGWPGLCDPILSSNGSERLAMHLQEAKKMPPRPDLKMINPFCDVILIGDFLDEVDRTKKWLEPLARENIRVHLLEITDPSEENFPYQGYIEFRDPESGEKLKANRADILQDEYRNLYLARREELARLSRTRGWSYTIHHTDQLASQAIIHIYQAMRV